MHDRLDDLFILDAEQAARELLLYGEGRIDLPIEQLRGTTDYLAPLLQSCGLLRHADACLLFAVVFETAEEGQVRRLVREFSELSIHSLEALKAGVTISELGDDEGLERIISRMLQFSPNLSQSELSQSFSRFRQIESPYADPDRELIANAFRAIEAVDSLAVMIAQEAKVHLTPFGDSHPSFEFEDQEGVDPGLSVSPDSDLTHSLGSDLAIGSYSDTTFDTDTDTPFGPDSVESVTEASSETVNHSVNDARSVEHDESDDLGESLPDFSHQSQHLLVPADSPHLAADDGNPTVELSTPADSSSAVLSPAVFPSALSIEPVSSSAISSPPVSSSATAEAQRGELVLTSETEGKNVKSKVGFARREISSIDVDGAFRKALRLANDGPWAQGMTTLLESIDVLDQVGLREALPLELQLLGNQEVFVQPKLAIMLGQELRHARVVGVGDAMLLSQTLILAIQLDRLVVFDRLAKQIAFFGGRIEVDTVLKRWRIVVPASSRLLRVAQLQVDGAQLAVPWAQFLGVEGKSTRQEAQLCIGSEPDKIRIQALGLVSTGVRFELGMSLRRRERYRGLVMIASGDCLPVYA
jgi:hypothetical protein